MSAANFTPSPAPLSMSTAQAKILRQIERGQTEFHTQQQRSLQVLLGLGFLEFSEDTNRFSVTAAGIDALARVFGAAP